ncbi:hypothetical protein LMJ63_25840, partial [Escherichia coli]|nr:hypothetical protein [Escherichia coli]
MLLGYGAGAAGLVALLLALLLTGILLTWWGWRYALGAKGPSSLTGTDDMKRLKSAALLLPLLPLLPLLALSACTHHLSSAELHAKHYVYQTR